MEFLCLETLKRLSVVFARFAAVPFLILYIPKTSCQRAAPLPDHPLVPAPDQPETPDQPLAPETPLKPLVPE